MRKIAATVAVMAVIGTPVLAADMALKAPPAPVAPAWSWTGFYLGAEAGYGWGTSNQSFTLGGGGTVGNYNISGGEGGGTVGFNYQFDPHWVTGLEGDISGANIKGTAGSSLSYACGDVCQSKVTWFDTFRGRLGYLVNNNVLLYGTGGVAYGRLETDDGVAVPGAIKSTVNRQGWTAGAGVEYGFAPHWSAKLEYLFADFKTFTWTNAAGCGPLNCTTFDRFNVVRAGINYNFNDLH
jgi:outer membrane immunogenic protein